MAKLKPGAKRSDPPPPVDPSKLKPAVERQLLAFIKNGATIDDACAAAGISQATYNNWKRLGHADPRGPLGVFVANLDVALAQAKLKSVSALHKNKEWRSKAHWLAHRYPKEWGNQPQEVKITHDDRPYKDKSEAELDAIEAEAKATEAAYVAALAGFAQGQSGEGESASRESNSGESLP